MQDSTPTTPGATVLGYPRIGRRRELKKAVEGFWAGRLDGAALDETAAAVRRDALDTMSAAELDSVPVNTFSWYDQVLDTCVLVGAVPERHLAVSGDHALAGFDAARYFAMARGTADVTPMEMTKWFDTNYHYIVPEIGPETAFALHADKPLTEYSEASASGLSARPVVVGPYTFLTLAKPADGVDDAFDPLSRLDDLVEIYAQLLGELHAAGVEWVQIDEPAAVRELAPEQVTLLRGVYDRLGAVADRPKILVATYFAAPVEALPALAETPVEGFALDLVRGFDADDVSGIDLSTKTLLLGAVNGRNVWRNDLSATLASLQAWKDVSASASISTSCSLLHVPYDVAVETGLEPRLAETLAFAVQKLDEVVALDTAFTTGEQGAAFTDSDHAVAGHDQVPGLVDQAVRDRLAAVAAGDRDREPQDERDTAQAAELGLPALPTTTIGSFPQTTELRTARADLRRGTIDAAAYEKVMKDEVREVVALQEKLGLDVLVHGEPERNDMVQYFAEQLSGYAFTELAWVQSYGSRCVRPPILFGDISRPTPMTVAWSAFAQSLTDKPMKGMLTGPVTMLAWSFVREDQPRSVTSDQVALALRDEVHDLEAAGIRIIQVDEPALRETLPIRRSEQAEYLTWSVDSFRLATAGVAVGTQIHTHLCYSEFGEIIDAIDGLNADVTSIEAARSRMELLGDVAAHGFSGGLGPGVYDIHSPRVPGEHEVDELIAAALESLPATALWVNPDCGLKTRGYAEVEPALEHLVAATHRVRSRLG